MLIGDYTHSQNISHKLYEELYSNYHIKSTEMHTQQSISDEIASEIRKIIVHEYRNPKWFDMLVTRRSNFQIKELNISEFVRKELLVLIKELPEYYSSILHKIEFQNRPIPEVAELFGLTKEEMEKSWIEARYCLLALLLSMFTDLTRFSGGPICGRSRLNWQIVEFVQLMNKLIGYFPDKPEPESRKKGVLNDN